MAKNYNMSEETRKLLGLTSSEPVKQRTRETASIMSDETRNILAGGAVDSFSPPTQQYTAPRQTQFLPTSVQNPIANRGLNNLIGATRSNSTPTFNERSMIANNGANNLYNTALQMQMNNTTPTDNRYKTQGSSYNLSQQDAMRLQDIDRNLDILRSQSNRDLYRGNEVANRNKDEWKNITGYDYKDPWDMRLSETFDEYENYYNRANELLGKKELTKEEKKELTKIRGLKVNGLSIADQYLANGDIVNGTKWKDLQSNISSRRNGGTAVTRGLVEGTGATSVAEAVANGIVNLMPEGANKEATRNAFDSQLGNYRTANSYAADNNPIGYNVGNQVGEIAKMMAISGGVEAIGGAAIGAGASGIAGSIGGATTTEAIASNALKSGLTMSLSSAIGNVGSLSSGRMSGNEFTKDVVKSGAGGALMSVASGFVSSSFENYLVKSGKQTQWLGYVKNMASSAAGAGTMTAVGSADKMKTFEQYKQSQLAIAEKMGGALPSDDALKQNYKEYMAQVGKEAGITFATMFLFDSINSLIRTRAMNNASYERLQQEYYQMQSEFAQMMDEAQYSGTTREEFAQSVIDRANRMKTDIGSTYYEGQQAFVDEVNGALDQVIENCNTILNGTTSAPNTSYTPSLGMDASSPVNPTYTSEESPKLIGEVRDSQLVSDTAKAIEEGIIGGTVATEPTTTPTSLEQIATEIASGEAPSEPMPIETEKAPYTAPTEEVNKTVEEKETPSLTENNDSDKLVDNKRISLIKDAAENSTLGESAKKALIENYDGKADPEKYVAAMYDYQLAAKNNTPMDLVIQREGYVLPAEAAKNMYMAQKQDELEVSDYGRGENLVREESGDWDDSENSGEQSGGILEETERDGGFRGNESGEIQKENDGRIPGRKELKDVVVGRAVDVIKQEGLDSNNTAIVIKNDATPEVAATAEYLGGFGVETTTIVGSNLSFNGGRDSARAYTVKGTNKVVLRADHPDFEGIQLAKHEIVHQMKDNGIVEKKHLSTTVRSTIGDSAYNHFLDRYKEAYEGYDDDYEMEMLCDFHGGMNTISKADDPKLITERYIETISKAKAALEPIIDGHKKDLRSYYESKGLSKPNNGLTEKQNIALENTGVGYDADSGIFYPSEFSRQTWAESPYETDRATAIETISKVTGRTKEEVGKWLDDVSGVASVIAESKGRLDYTSSPGMSAVIPNSEYGGSIENSTICEKRRPYTGTIQAIQRALPNTALLPEDYLDIKRIMKDKKIDVPCAMCYVEGSRINLGVYTKEFLKKYKETNPSFMPNMADLNTPDGLEYIRIYQPQVYEAYNYFMNNHGTLSKSEKALFASQQKPKMYQVATAYDGEILDMFKGKPQSVAEKNEAGGFRFNSFSDQEVVHLIDTMQAITDMSAVGLYGQGYTKQVIFADAVGPTGLKVNCSLVANGTTLDESGKPILTFDEVEGMRWADVERLRRENSKNVGSIVCAFNDEQLMAALRDNRIDFIIPFHRSQWTKKHYAKMGLVGKIKDYTNQQNEKWLDPSKHTHTWRDKEVKTKCTNYYPNQYWEYDKDGVYNANKYLDMCFNDGKRPKFYKLLDKAPNGKFSLKADGSTDGYWKLLIDFKMYDNDGVGAQQTAVVPDFNMNAINNALDNYAGGHDTFPVAQDVVDDFVNEYKSKHKDTLQFSRELTKGVENRQTVDSEGNNLTEAQIEFFKNSVIRDENGNLLVLYHGTERGGFTIFDSDYGNSSPYFFFTDNPKIARGYSGTSQKFTPKKPKTYTFDQAKNYIRRKSTNDYNTKARLVKEGNEYVLYDDCTIDYEATEKIKAKYIVYEGGKEDFRDTDLQKVVSRFNELYDYGDSTYLEPVMYATYLNITNPLVVDAKGNDWENIKVPWQDEAMNSNELAEYAKEKGYDGLVIKNVYDIGIYTSQSNQVPATDVIAFKPEQIKSIKNTEPTNNPDIRYSREMEAKYLELAKDPVKNRRQLEGMVLEAAYTHGYGLFERYHQTSKMFTEFNTDNPVAGANDSETPNGIFVKDNDHDIGLGGNIQMKLFTKLGNQLVFNNRKEANAWYCENVPGYDALQNEMETELGKIEEKIKALEDQWFREGVSDEEVERLSEEEDKLINDVLGPKEQEFRGQLRELLNDYFLSGKSGYDSIELKDDGHRWVNGKREDVHTYILFDPTQVKSADPVTYDDDGKVIPLDKRFDSKNNDLRYSRNFSSDNLQSKNNTVINGLPNGMEVNQKDAERINNGGKTWLPPTSDTATTGSDLVNQSKTVRESLSSWRFERSSGETIQSYDSEGIIISEDDVQKLIGTVVVDTQKRPLDVYHVTDTDFTEHKYGDIGFHYGPYVQALDIARAKEFKDPIMKRAMLVIKKPAVLYVDLNLWYPDDIADALMEYEYITSDECDEVHKVVNGELDEYGEDIPKEVKYQLKSMVMLREMLAKRDIDGIAYMNGNEHAGFSYIVFDNSQIIPADINDDDNTSSLSKTTDLDDDLLLDDWLTDSDGIMDELRAELNNETTNAPKRIKRNAEQMRNVISGDSFNLEGNRATYTDERIDRVVNDHDYGNGRSDAYLTYINPKDFLKLTTLGYTKFIENETSRGRVSGLDIDKLRSETQTPFLDIEMNASGARVTGHEGRHRMIAMMNAGIERVPVILIDRANRYSNGKSVLSQLNLHGQSFYSKRSNARISVADALPITSTNADEIRNRFGGESSLQFSRELSTRTSELAETNKKLKEQLREADRFRGKAEEEIKYLRKQFTLTEVKEADTRSVNRLTKQYLEEYGAGRNTDKEVIRNGLKAIGEMWLNADTVDDALADRIYDEGLKVAHEIVTNAEILNDTEAERYKKIKDYLKNTPVAVSPATQKDMTDFGDFKKRNRGIKISSAASVNVSELYNDLREIAPDLFIDVPTESEMLYQIESVLQEEESIYSPAYGSLDIAMATDEIAMRILGDAISNKIESVASTFADRKQAMIDLRDQKLIDQAKHYQERIKDIYQGKNEALDKQKTRYQEMLDKEVSFRKEKVQKLKEHYAEVRENARNRKLDSQSRQRLLKIVKRLRNKKMTTPNRELVNQFISDLDSVSVSLTQRSVQNLTDIRDWYEDQKENNPDFIPNSSIEDKIRRLSRKHISDLTLEEVASLTEVLLNIENRINYERHLINDVKRRDTYLMAEETVDDINNFKAIGNTKAFEKLDELFVEGTLSPVRFMHRLTGYVEDDPLYELTNALADGQRKQLKFEMDANKSFGKWIDDKKFMGRISGPTAKAIEISGTGKNGNPVKATISPDMRMYLYLALRNEDNLNHIAGGGITCPNWSEYKKGDMGKAFDKGTTIVKLTPSQIREICKDMPDDEKAFAEKAALFFDRTSRDAINETSEALEGFSLAAVDNYLPITTNPDFTKADFEGLKKDGTVEGMGFLKERVNASNPIMIPGLSYTLAKSIKGTAKYYGMAIPVRNFNKVYRTNTTYWSTNEAGESVATHFNDSIPYAIKQTWGSRAQKYIEDMMTDVQTGRPGSQDVWGKILGGARGNYAGSTLSMNWSVALKQAASYPTAGAVVGMGPLMYALRPDNLAKKVDVDLIAKYTPMLWVRDKNTELSTAQNQLKQNFVQKALNSKALNWITDMDILTVKRLWVASEGYVKMHNKLLNPGTDAFYVEVAKVFNRVVEETQPNYTAMQRPALLRTDNPVVQTLMMFKTQPFQNFNILYDAMGNLSAKMTQYKANRSEETKRRLKEAQIGAVNAVTSQLMQLAVFATMTFLNGFIRGKHDKWDDEEGNITFQSIAKGIGKDMIGGAASIVPFGSDIYDYISSKVFDEKYYGFESVTDSVIKDVVSGFDNAYTELTEMLEDVKKGDFDFDKHRFALDKIASPMSKAFGIPYDNVKNLINALFLNTVKVGAKAGGIDKYEGQLAYLYFTQNPSKKPGEFYDLLKEAYDDNPEAYKKVYDSLIEHGFTEKKIKDNVEDRMKKEAGVTSVKDLDERFATPEEKEHIDAEKSAYDLAIETLTGSKYYDKLDNTSKDKVESAIGRMYKGDWDSLDKVRTYEKEAGIDETKYVLYNAALYASDSDGNGSFKKEEKVDALTKLVNDGTFTKKQASYMFDELYPNSKTPNPFK